MRTCTCPGGATQKPLGVCVCACSAVNTASRMESHGYPMCVHVSDSTRKAAQAVAVDKGYTPSAELLVPPYAEEVRRRWWGCAVGAVHRHCKRLLLLAPEGPHALCAPLHGPSESPARACRMAAPSFTLCWVCVSGARRMACRPCRCRWGAWPPTGPRAANET